MNTNCISLPLSFKKLLFSASLLWVVNFGFGQVDHPSNTLTFTGLVKKEKTFSLTDLQKWKAVDLGDVNTSCSSKKKEMAHGVKAILLKEVMDSVAFSYTNSHSLNSFYFKFVAADGYTLVYSFGEIFNSETGNHLYLVMEKEGKPITSMENRILLLTTSDLKQGSRNMKWLEKIVVCRTE